MLDDDEALAVLVVFILAVIAVTVLLMRLFLWLQGLS
jgi:uncharacterized protein YebE (UPF0316 family)